MFVPFESVSGTSLNQCYGILCTLDDIDDQWAFFHTILEECLNYFLPFTKVKFVLKNLKGQTHGSLRVFLITL